MSKQNSVSCDERRAHVRYSHTLRTLCRRQGREGAASWTARVRDVSRSGISLVMPREVRVGVVLVVALEGLRGHFVRPILMRVVRAQPEGKRGWLAGCTFVTPLTDNDVEALRLPCGSAEPGPSSLPF